MTGVPFDDREIFLIREANPLADVVREHGVALTETEHGLTGCCPFHTENVPSFHVTPARGYWYCFGCAEGGDVIGFVRKTRSLGFMDALRFLADRAGLTRGGE
ncbi:CHC2 zinc finger domain-containing protein [Microbispora amethystogenes]|uniref:CHC2 zinc finger domain-containing protein n=1 Tax=Microbispora amethystogenes TaxID=1427754 RepID=UPI0033D2115D